MKGFIEFTEEQRLKKILEEMLLFEHHTYKRIPGTRSSYREDPPHTNISLRHSHSYADVDGKGKQLYSVNIDGSGHDGNSGAEIPAAHADFFRNKGYKIPTSNVLESILPNVLLKDESQVFILEDGSLPVYLTETFRD